MAGVTLSGVSPGSIGLQYDIAIGYDPGNGQVQMVGYVLKNNAFQESTDIQDSDHLVQITATNNADRFTRYPKSSQGDWTGGERQVFAPTASSFSNVSANAYYSSDGNMNTTVPGNLTPLPAWATSPVSVIATQPFSVQAANSATLLWINAGVTGTENFQNLSSFNVTAHHGTIGDGSKIMGFNSNSFSQASDAMFVGLQNGGGANNGVLRVSSNGTTLDQYCNDAIANTCNSMAYFAGNIYYLNSTSNKLAHVVIGSPLGNNPGVSDLSLNSGAFGGEAAGPAFLVSNDVSLYFGTVTVKGTTIIYSYDGTTPTRLGSIPGNPVGVGAVNGIVYILCQMIQGVSQSTNTPYCIYQIDGSSISVFDDLRSLPTTFQPQFGTLGSSIYVGGNFASDGKYLYAAIPGLGLKAYDLSTPGNPVCQILPLVVPKTGSTEISCYTILIPPLGSFGGAGPIFLNQDNSPQILMTQRNNSNSSPGGTVTSSFIDFGAPTIIKAWRSIDVEMVTPVYIFDPNLTVVGQPTSGQVVMTAVVDNGPTIGGGLGITGVVDRAGNIKFPLPSGTKGYRLQYTIQLLANPSFPTVPVIRSISVRGTLGRAWSGTVQAYRGQRGRDNYSAGEDTQGLRAQDKIANIINSYLIGGGNVYMYIPSATFNTTHTTNLPGTTNGVQNSVTLPAGVELVTATLEDYKLSTRQAPGEYQTEYGANDMEADIEVTLVEAL